MWVAPRDGKNTLVSHPNGVREERSYLAQDWLSTLVTRAASGTVLDQFTYSYRPTGHLSQELDLGNRTHAFGYNNLYELTSESHPDIGSVAYTYDKNGNRATRQDGTGTDYYSADGNNKLNWVNHGVNARPTSGQTGAYELFTYSVFAPGLRQAAWPREEEGAPVEATPSVGPQSAAGAYIISAIRSSKHPRFRPRG